MEFQHRYNERSSPGRIALFPGAFNPPTIAHLAIARAARTWAEEVIWILPRTFPHKDFDGMDLAERLELLRLLTIGNSGFSVAVANGGLYVEIADEAREFFGPEPEIALVCGRDAAERIAAWDYGRPGVFDHMIERYPLLIAARAGDYLAAPHHAAPNHAGRIMTLPMDPVYYDVSSTEVRRRMACGEPWRHLVPAQISNEVAAALSKHPRRPGQAIS